MPTAFMYISRMLTILLVVLAPLAIVVLPTELGFAVAAFTVVLLTYREWDKVRQAKLTAEIERNTREALGRESITEIGKLHAAKVKTRGTIAQGRTARRRTDDSSRQ
jgi:hypothetical protein